MKKIMLLLLMHTTLFSFDIEVKVTNIKNQKGKIYIGLYNKAKGFTKISKTFEKSIMPIKSKNILYTFQDIPKGVYAISVFHDENNNEKLDTNFVGLPKENYGFSHNIKHLLKATSFKEAKFDLNKNVHLKIDIGE